MSTAGRRESCDLLRRPVVDEIRSDDCPRTTTKASKPTTMMISRHGQSPARQPHHRFAVSGRARVTGPPFRRSRRRTRGRRRRSVSAGEVRGTQSSYALRRNRSRTISATVLTTNVIMNSSRAPPGRACGSACCPRTRRASRVAIVGRQSLKTVEDIHVHDRRVAGRHQHDHRLADGPAQADHQRRKQSAHRRRNDDPHGGLPGRGSSAQRRRAEMRGDRRQGVVGDRVNQRNDRRIPSRSRRPAQLRCSYVPTSEPRGSRSKPVKNTRAAAP